MIPFLIFCLINFGLVMLSKKSFGVTLPVTLTGVTLLTYFGQFLFGPLQFAGQLGRFLKQVAL